MNIGTTDNDNCRKEIFCSYIDKNGKKIYPKSGKVFHFWLNSAKST